MNFTFWYIRLLLYIYHIFYLVNASESVVSKCIASEAVSVSDVIFSNVPVKEHPSIFRDVPSSKNI